MIQTPSDYAVFAGQGKAISLQSASYMDKGGSALDSVCLVDRTSSPSLAQDEQWFNWSPTKAGRYFSLSASSSYPQKVH